MGAHRTAWIFDGSKRTPAPAGRLLHVRVSASWYDQFFNLSFEPRAGVHVPPMRRRIAKPRAF